MKHLLFIAALLASSAAHAVKTDNEIRSLETSIRTDIISIVEKIDPRAVVAVRVVPKSTQVELPLTPLTFENLIVRNEGGGPAIDRVEITVYTTKASFPDEVVGFLKRLSSLEGITTNLSIEPLPKQVMDVLEDKGQSLGQQLEGVIGSATQSFIRFQQYELIGTTLLGVIALLAGLYFLRGRLSPMGAGAGGAAAADPSMARIADSLEQLSIRSSQGEGPRPSQIAPQEPRLPAGGGNSSSEEKVLEGLGKPGVLALLSDCYWGKFDGYAAYIWNRTPVGVRREIVAEYPALARYTAFLSEVPEENLARHNEPYYLNPYPIFHLDNAELTKLVRKYPRLLGTISSLRLEGLKLSAKEKIELNSEINGDLPGDNNLPARTGFRERNLARRAAIRLESIEEEEEILGLGNLTNDLKAQIPTLGWLLEVPKEQVRSHLEKYSARDLASAWIGPERVLNFLGELLPEKKRRLVEEYCEKGAPSRNSQVFKALFDFSFEWLASQEQVPVEEEKNVA